MTSTSRKVEGGGRSREARRRNSHVLSITRAAALAATLLPGCSPSHPTNARTPPAGDGTPPANTPPQAAPNPSSGPASFPPGDPAGVVSFVSVTSDHVADVSSLEAWQQSFIRADMSDDEKAQAVWRSVASFRHQDEPAREFIESSAHPHDPIRLFNVYGYSQCDCTSAAIEALARSIGLDARVRSLSSHVVAEVNLGGAWRMLDASYIDWFPQPDGTLAGVDAISAAVNGWLAQRPDLAGNRAGLLSFMKNGGWRNGPALLAASPFYDEDGLFPARVQGWADTMLEYPAQSPVSDSGYTLGYRVNVQLRAGERIVRGWSNQGRHINDDLGLSCDSVGAVPGQGDFVYSPAYGDLAPGRVGNGLHQYTLPLGTSAYRAGALVADNIADSSDSPRLTPADATRPATLVVRMPSSWVALGGLSTVDARVGSGGSIAVAVSRNHGVDWTNVSTLTADGRYSIDLSPWVRRQYDYRLRFVISGAGSGLDALSIADTIQYSQRALPALTAGDNRIHVTTGAAEGTVTLEASTDSTQTHNRVYGEYHPVVSGLAEWPLHPTGGRGALTFPVETPGDLVRLRFGLYYRARGAGDRWDYQVSFDDGASFTPVDAAVGPIVSGERFVSFGQIPPGTRRALVRFAGTQTNTLNLFDFRIDADYREPAGGFAPFQVTYQWTENGQPHSDVHQVNAPNETYTIHCDTTPTMGALVVER